MISRSIFLAVVTLSSMIAEAETVKSPLYLVPSKCDAATDNSSEPSDERKDIIKALIERHGLDFKSYFKTVDEISSGKVPTPTWWNADLFDESLNESVRNVLLHNVLEEDASPIRRSLLRYFASTRASSNGVFVKVNARDFQRPGYIPLTNTDQDNAALFAFLTAANPPFVAVCGKEHPEIAPFDPLYAKVTQLYEASFKKADLGESFPADKPPAKHNFEFSGRELLLVRNNSQFAEPPAKTEGILVETVFPESDDAEHDEIALEAEGALGWRWSLMKRFEPDKHNLPSHLRPYNMFKATASATPYVAAHRELTKYLDANLLNADGLPTTRYILPTRLAAGIRFDLVSEYERNPSLTCHLPGSTPDRKRPCTPVQLLYMNQSAPSHEFGFFAEGFTDSFNTYSGYQLGLDYSPEFWGAFGYKRPFPLSTWLRRPATSAEADRYDRPELILGALRSGWFAEWDTTLGIRYIDYSRLPFDYTEPTPGATEPFKFRTDQSDEVYAGGNFSASFSKRNMFGLPADAAHFSFNTEISYFDSFRTDTDQFLYGKFSIALVDPDFAHRKLSLSYETGDKYPIGGGETKVSIGLAFRN